MEIVERSIREYDVPLNVAVWMAFKPLIKIYLSIGTGFVLSKHGILTPSLQKGISRIVLLVLIPCLIFNNMVSEIKDTDIKLLGVIVFSGFMFYTIGFLWGLVVYLISPIPRAWFGGLLLCCMINNSSDLPLAYVQAIGGSPLFPAGMSELGVSYCVLFLIAFILFSFNLGGTRLIAWDAHRNAKDPRKNEPTVPALSWGGLKTAAKHLRAHAGEMLHGDFSSLKRHKPDAPAGPPPHTSAQAVLDYDEEATRKYYEEESKHGTPADGDAEMPPVQRSETDNSEIRFPPPVRHMHHWEDAPEPSEKEAASAAEGSSLRRIFSRRSARSARSTRTARSSASSAPSLTPEERQRLSLSRLSSHANPADPRNVDTAANSAKHLRGEDDDDDDNSSNAPLSWRARKWAAFKVRWFKFKSKNFATTYLCNFLEDIFLPQMLSMIAGITVAMIPWVRRVFVTGQDIKGFHDAPDGAPPLDFFMEFLSFFGAAQVPLGLMLLGATIAQLELKALVPGFWKTLCLIVVFKLCLLPIIACGWITRMREIGWLDYSDTMTPIVLAIVSGTPSATVQIYLTVAFIENPNEESVEMNCLAVALLAQYALLPITLTFVGTFVIMHFV